MMNRLLKNKRKKSPELSPQDSPSRIPENTAAGPAEDQQLPASGARKSDVVVGAAEYKNSLTSECF